MVKIWALTFLFILTWTSVLAVDVVSNLSGTTAGSASPQSTLWLAQRFTTNNQEYQINTLTIRGARHASQSLLVYIYAHDSVNNTPVSGGTGFGQFNATGVTATIEDQVMLAMGTIILAPNTTYWIVVQPSNVNTGFWTQTTDLGNLSGSGIIENRRASSGNSGTTWSGSTNGTSNLMIGIDAVLTPVELMSFKIQ